MRYVTPLMVAASRGELECMKLLIAAGADRNIKDKGGEQAASYAQSHLEFWREIAKEGPTDFSAELGIDMEPLSADEPLQKAEESARLLGVLE